MTRLQKILLSIVAVLLVSLVIVTLVRLIFKPNEIGTNFRKKEPSIERAIEKQEKTEFAVFSSIGRLRLSSADGEGFIIILTPYFYYPKNDVSFYEELVTKNQKIRVLISQYFGSKTAEAIKMTKENNIKKELLEILNNELVMGKIDDLYFEEYIFLD